MSAKVEQAGKHNIIIGHMIWLSCFPAVNVTVFRIVYPPVTKPHFLRRCCHYVRERNLLKLPYEQISRGKRLLNALSCARVCRECGSTTQFQPHSKRTDAGDTTLPGQYFWSRCLHLQHFTLPQRLGCARPCVSCFEGDCRDS